LSGWQKYQYRQRQAVTIFDIVGQRLRLRDKFPAAIAAAVAGISTGGELG